jgi:WhiB family redox-sensing transcriptional regulator
VNWRRRAACRDVGTDMFFPVGTTGKTLERDLLRAFAVCARCPVRADCAAERPTTGSGVWAGVYYLDNGTPWTPPSGQILGRDLVEATP